MTRLHDANDLAVLLAEERDGSCALGLFAVGLACAHGLVAEHLGVDEVFDPVDLLFGHRPEMTEVEPESVGRDERSLLSHVVAEHLTKRPVQEVGPGVVAPDRVPTVAVDRCHGFLGGLYRSVF